MSILWTAVAIALVIAIIKASGKILKFVFTVAVIAVILLLLRSLGVF